METMAGETSARPKRVACLLPSASETLAFISGGLELLVGRSHECDFPGSLLTSNIPVLTRALNQFESSRQMHEAVSSAMEVGAGLYAVDKDLLLSLRPDVILTQSLCSVCSVDANIVHRIVAQLPHPRPVVVTLNPSNLQDVIADCITVGDAVGLGSEGRAAAASLTQRLAAAQSLVQTLAPAPPSPPHGMVTAFLEWTDPIFPGGHWTPQLIHLAGGTHPINPPSAPGAGAPPSVEVPVQAVVDCDPDWIILCPCGLDLEAAEAETEGIATAPWWRGLRAVREDRVVVVDGNQMFNRPGPRLLDALEWLVALLHRRPELMPAGFPWRRWKQPQIDDAASAHRSSTDAVSDSKAPCLPGCSSTAGCGGAPGLRIPCSPLGLPVDIEEAHQAACSAGKKHYTDPCTGYMAFTEEGLLARGNCCGRRCRHCPYGHLRVRKAQRLNLPSRPLLLDPMTLQQRLDKLQLRTGASGEGKPGMVLVVWDGSCLPTARIDRIEEDGKVPVLLLAFHRGLTFDPAAADQSCLVQRWGLDSASTPDGVLPGSTAEAVNHNQHQQGGEGVAARPDVTLSAALDLSMERELPVLAVPILDGEVCFGSRAALGAGQGGSLLEGGVQEQAPSSSASPWSGCVSRQLLESVLHAAVGAMRRTLESGTPGGGGRGAGGAGQIWLCPPCGAGQLGAITEEEASASTRVWEDAAKSAEVQLFL